MAKKPKKSDSISTADLKKTRGGALQYGSGEDFEKHYNKLFDKYLNAESANAFDSLDPDILEKMGRLKAGKYATTKYDRDAKLENLMMKYAKEQAKETKTPKARGKAKGGVVRAMQNGGAVMKGRGPKFKGQS